MRRGEPDLLKMEKHAAPVFRAVSDLFCFDWERRVSLRGQDEEACDVGSAALVYLQLLASPPQANVTVLR